jgi:hypothetical protein
MELWGSSLASEKDLKDYTYYTLEGTQYELYKNLEITATNYSLLAWTSTKYNYQWTRSQYAGYEEDFLYIAKTGKWANNSVAYTGTILPAFSL